jgi:hypothetical protein
MNDVFEPLREMPEPPLKPSAQALASARESTRRRVAVRVAVGIATAIAVAVGVPVLLQPPPVRLEAASPATPSLSPSPSRTPAPQAPAPEAVDRHSTDIAKTLITAVPDGYTAVPDGYKATSLKLTDYRAKVPMTFVARIAIGEGGYRSVTLVRVSAERGSGVVAAVFGTDLPAPAADADACQSHADLGIEAAVIEHCEIVTVDGATVRLVTGRDPGVGRVMSATRYLRGGYVVVSASQGVRAYRISPAGEAWIWEVAVNPLHERALSELPFTADRLAALALDPALLPEKSSR